MGRDAQKEIGEGERPPSKNSGNEGRFIFLLPKGKGGKVCPNTIVWYNKRESKEKHTGDNDTGKGEATLHRKP